MTQPAIGRMGGGLREEEEEGQVVNTIYDFIKEKSFSVCSIG